VGQYAWVLDVWLLVMMGLITWAVSSEGLWGAALMFVNVMFAGLIAFSIFEPAANLLASNIPFMVAFADFVSLVILFTVAFVLLRLATDNLGFYMVRFPGWLYHVGRYLFAAFTAWYLMGMVLCMLQTAPIHKQFLGYQWQRHAFWGMGIDRFWLGYVQSATQTTFDWDPPNPFDHTSSFIIRYHNHRGFGDPDPQMPGARPAAAASPQSQPAGGQAPARQPATPAGAAGVAPPGQ
jgi:hypothetical protein